MSSQSTIFASRKVKDVPIVAVYNYLETFIKFLSRADETDLIRRRQYRGDRAQLWLGDPKLLFVATPVPQGEMLRRRWGYLGTEVLAPTNGSHQLSLDILREPRLLHRLIEYAGPGRVVQLIPYATTREFLHLAGTLRAEHGLTVLLPESPSPENLWLRDYVDTKAGFRLLASQWLTDSELLPFGMAHRDLSQVAETIRWFNARGQTCIVKPDGGVSGIGQLIFSPQDLASSESILRQLEHELFLRNDLVIVERYIHSSARISPSLEFFVPPLGVGEPEVTYLSNQIFKSGHFAGILIDREQLNTQWYPVLERNGLEIAARLQEMGYVGHFDLDAIVDDDERLFLLEVNTRRTGGTFVHEFARFAFGPNYLDNVVLLGHNRVTSKGITSVDELLAVVGDLLYPMHSQRRDTQQRGIVITVTSALQVGQFGCIFVASSAQEAMALQQMLLERLPGDQ